MYASNVRFASNVCIVNAGNCSNFCTAVSRLKYTNDQTSHYHNYKRMYK